MILRFLADQEAKVSDINPLALLLYYLKEISKSHRGNVITFCPLNVFITPALTAAVFSVLSYCRSTTRTGAFVSPLMIFNEDRYSCPSENIITSRYSVFPDSSLDV